MINDETPCWALVPATGIGSRMQADRPKQYLQLQGKTILEHTLDNLLSYHAIDGVMLVLHPQDVYWSQIDYVSDKTVLICNGGEERHHSVFNGLDGLSAMISDDSMILIHDAVRPFFRHEDLDRLLQAALADEAGAILAAPVADTLKRADQQGIHQPRIAETQVRTGLWRAFTPQAFRLGQIYQALERVIEQQLVVTDDASAMELNGFQPLLVNADTRNIKITHPEDLALARLLLSSMIATDR